MRQPDFTLSAGPTMASPGVLAAQAAPITYHYDPAFLEAFRRTERKVGAAVPHEPGHPAHAGRGDARARGGGARSRAAGHPVPQHRLGRVRALHGLLAARLRRRAARARGAVRRLGRCRRRRSLPDRASRDRVRERRPLRDAVGHAEPGRRDRPDREGARLPDVRRLRVVARRHADLPGRVELDICVAGAQKCLGRASRHVADERERGRLGARSGRIPPRRAARSCRCSTGRSSGSTARSSRSRRRSSTCTASRPRATIVLEQGLEAIVRPARAGRPGDAAPACAPWGSSCGRAARRSRPHA